MPSLSYNSRHEINKVILSNIFILFRTKKEKKIRNLKFCKNFGIFLSENCE